jgi:hypothetical protein
LVHLLSSRLARLGLPETEGRSGQLALARKFLANQVPRSATNEPNVSFIVQLGNARGSKESKGDL